MSEQLYGPWHITLNAPVINVLGFRRARLLVTGSNTADGEYDLPSVPGVSYEVGIDGAAWILDIAIFNSHMGFQRFETRRSTHFDREQGLTANVEVGVAPANHHAVSLFYVNLLCRSLDPKINPPEVPDLFDFTLPRG